MDAGEAADVLRMSATEMADRIAARELSPVELTEAVLRRIESVDPALNAYCTVTDELAMEQARAAEAALARGERRGRLHGVPVSVKDLTDTKGVRTTYGSKLFEDHVPEEDSVLVERLREAGCVLVGKTNTPDHGTKGVTDNLVFGVTRNPWNLELTPGGSSGGAAAAVATGMGPLAEGSDFAGSIRIPAAFCGVVGLKPSDGRVPVYPDKLIGHPVPFISGPITRTVRDAAAMLDALVGPDDRDPRALPHTGESFERAAAEERSLAGLRLGWSPDLGCVPIDPDVARLCGEGVGALEGIGVAVEEDSTSFAGTEEAYSLLNAVLRAGLMAPYLPERADEMDPLLVKRSELANARTATDVGTAEILQSDVYHRLRKLFERYDVLATPTTATPPFELGRNYPDSVGGEKVESPYRLLPLTYVFNLSGHPAISVPAGWTDDGRPVGLQLIGRPRADAELLSIAAAYERARPWAQRWPKLPERAPAAQG